MKKATIVCLASLALGVSSLVRAQAPSHPKYVEVFKEGEEFADLYQAWRPGQALLSNRPNDEEFFISRVRPRVRFTDRETQVDKELSTARKVLWWVPIGIGQWNAIPSYFFNSEVFSTWSYIDHWGNWTAPYLRMPAAFSDAAHKNGVSVSATSPVAFAANVNTYGGDGRKYNTVINNGVDKYINYLRYYGIDGAGYNSEFNMPSYFASSMRNFLASVSKKAKEVGFDFYSNVWYSITGNAGNMPHPWDALHSGNMGWFDTNGTVSTHFFLNYNWSQSYFDMSKRNAQSVGRDPYDVYAGINMQKGSGVSWNLIKNNQVSIGIWGAHNANMIFENRGGVGGNPLNQQKEYQLASEYVFTGGKHNPISHHELGRVLPGSSQSASTFAGISSMVPARSALGWDLDKEPFVTYLNLGNGQSFNLGGETKFAGEWYNLGMQDYMPTWRWWFSKNFMGRTEVDLPAKSLKAEFIWSDAWFGGSCLEISGEEVEQQYLQLFKTKYALKPGDKLLIRYKMVSGRGELSWATYATGEQGEVSAPIFKEGDPVDYDTWVEKEVTVGTGRSALAMSNKTLGMLGLKFAKTNKDFRIRIGEIALTRGEYQKPQQPTIKAFEVLENNYRGHDFKLVFSMGELKPDKTVTYNDEVHAWYYKIYSQQEGEKVEFCTATTSWAAYVVGAKLNLSGSRNVRYGVSAVSLDGKYETDIAWTQMQPLKTSSIEDVFTADRSTVSSGETVTITFDDSRHAEAQKWSAVVNGEEAFSAVNAKTFVFTPTKVGGYDIICTLANGTQLKRPTMVSVVPESAGTTPKILTLTANGKTEQAANSSLEVKPDTEVTMAFSSNKSKGAVSRALRIKDNTFKIPNIYRTLGIRLGNGGTDKDGLTLSFWVRPMNTKYSAGEDGGRFVDISRPRESWPFSEWGYFWVNYGSGLSKGKPRTPIDGFVWTNMTTDYHDKSDARGKFIDVKKPYKLEPGVWYHMTVSIGYDLSTKLYINGEKLGEEPRTSARSNFFSSGVDLNISRYAKFGSALDAFIDEVRVYNRVLSEEEVKGTMQHLTNPSSEEGLKAYFDFEAEPLSNGDIRSSVGNEVVGYVTTLTWKGEGDQQWDTNVAPPFGPSNGWVVGSSYPIETTASWTARKALQSDAKTTDTSGSVKLTWSKNGVYPVTLKLENAWGKDVKTYNVINVTKSSSAVDEVEMLDLTVYPNPFVEDVRLRFAEAGRYDVALYDLAGSLISRTSVDAEAASFHTLRVDAPAGLYLMRVMRDGRLITTVKLQKK